MTEPSFQILLQTREGRMTRERLPNNPSNIDEAVAAARLLLYGNPETWKIDIGEGDEPYLRERDNPCRNLKYAHNRLTRVQVISVYAEIPIDDWATEQAEEVNRRGLLMLQSEERKEYERLHEIYGNSPDSSGEGHGSSS